MAPRFLTAEDVRRAGGSEIVVDEATVVTPQALEVAQAAGIAIRTQRGAWTAPAPDRGPDAWRSAETLPHMPEPEEESSPSTAIVTAVGKNRKGVLAEISTHVAELGGSIHDVSQRVLDGYFHMILTVELEPDRSFSELKGCLECLGGPEDFAVRVMNEKVFRFMHRV